ncbi:Pkinase-domain-containing protein [Sistotremastrum niveocremeum HHB9708]|uniref:non-specific serine/threonine protein kinase n=2 Tax=Sistotremastraceae TaxID=3402574 RepID=A0A165A5S2_9AGAM|nr:Pkinase-domain-containing protein [Sistotremastrum niveocremeum HHB9708]KZT43553.1 Pkinase-domain-containing protein [Sistotremastrum suecicum HHB10207 ss-3]
MSNRADYPGHPSEAHVPVTQIYRKLEIVGKGSYGAVYKGEHIPSGTIVALKIIDLDTEDDDAADIQREVALLSQLRGEGANVTQYYGSWLDGPNVWIVMDFAGGGSVRTLMKAMANGVLEERWIVVIIREILIALAYLHKSNVIHRDIKTANMLVQSSGKVVLCDFGVSALLSSSHSKRTTFTGTPHYMAPEVISSSSYDSKADIWSLGITIFEMATGSQPLAELPSMQALALIPKAKPPRLTEQQGGKEMRDFMTHCLKELPSDRSTADELSRHKWIKNSSKTPSSSLRELLLRYDKWAQAGGVRQSLAEPAPWEMDSDRSIFIFLCILLISYHHFC